MKEYIEREASLQAMWNALYAIEDERENQHGLDLKERMSIQDGFEAGQQAIVNIPAADVVEVRHGEWIVDDAASEHCSCCGHKFYISALFAVGGNDEPNCCPNCGAKMDGGVSDAAD